MVKIEELLEPGETVIRKSGLLQSGRTAISPYGNLYLTSNRVVFIPKKLFSAVFGGLAALLKSGLHNIPLNTITEVKTSLGAIQVKADKKYTYVGGLGRTGGWVEAIQQAKAMFREEIPKPHPEASRRRTGRASPPPPPPPPPRTTARRTRLATPPPPPPAPATSTEFCTGCGAPLRQGDKFCGKCGKPVEAGPRVCPGCGSEMSPDDKFCRECGTRLS